MAKCLIVCVVAVCFFSELGSSIPLKKTQEELRASLITKHNFASHQRQKKELSVPKPFVVSTSLRVASPSKDSSKRQPKAIVTAADILKDVPVIEGVRMPDDESDRTTWRNGRVINNIFVSNDAPLPKETVVRSSVLKQVKKRKGRQFESLPNLPNPFNVDLQGQESSGGVGRDYTYKAGDTDNGRPVYYVVEDDLHADKGPYNYEPADSSSSAASTSINFPVSDLTQSGISLANNDDFVIKDHTYSLCPGCPTFSIPVPVPKASYQPSYLNPDNQIEGSESLLSPNKEPVYQYARNETFLEKIGDRIIATVQDFQNTILQATSKGQELFQFGNKEPNDIADKISKAVNNVEPQYKFAAAGMAAVAAIGSIAYYTITSHEADGSSEGRSLKDPNQLNSILEILQKVHDKYDTPPKCIDEEKCYILMEHIDQSPELTYAKKYYEFRYKIKNMDLCHQLRCSEEKTADETLKGSPTTTLRNLDIE
ncbi:uncharacterized protein [Lepeophtheirus salmonis]|uniref:uncharacterized protein n=1 Tax=Lepeophtheirus salmonis TaxID=72036 RepID=UPI001AE7F9CE|nr:uncharacterized protein LOC121121865 [Lepeophtheirus salmonis]XP_040572792.1 uncharacterized protein LOC121121865 [Lepeophtheirus salmonis]XP_040572793.1 uncharacterized protein LOC121121865 [Lepeophtheirus salmonis]XP_040572794.1 uncharacterized protein LOC121121865 [Lepeophtheirus salmonis]